MQKMRKYVGIPFETGYVHINNILFLRKVYGKMNPSVGKFVFLHSSSPITKLGPRKVDVRKHSPRRYYGTKYSRGVSNTVRRYLESV